MPVLPCKDFFIKQPQFGFQAALITPTMFTRYLTLISAFVLILIIIRNLFTRQQQRRLDTAAKQIATILLISSLIAATYTLLKS